MQHETPGRRGKSRIIAPGLVSRFPGGALAPPAKAGGYTSTGRARSEIALFRGRCFKHHCVVDMNITGVQRDDLIKSTLVLTAAGITGALSDRRVRWEVSADAEPLNELLREFAGGGSGSDSVVEVGRGGRGLGAVVGRSGKQGLRDVAEPNLYPAPVQLRAALPASVEPAVVALAIVEVVRVAHYYVEPETAVVDHVRTTALRMAIAICRRARRRRDDRRSKGGVGRRHVDAARQPQGYQADRQRPASPSPCPMCSHDRLRAPVCDPGEYCQVSVSQAADRNFSPVWPSLGLSSFSSPGRSVGVERGLAVLTIS